MIGDFFIMIFMASPILIPIIIVIIIFGDSDHYLVALPAWILIWCLYVLFFPFDLNTIINKIVSSYYTWYGILAWCLYALFAIIVSSKIDLFHFTSASHFSNNSNSVGDTRMHEYRCQQCNGTGIAHSGGECYACFGEGYNKEKQQYQSCNCGNDINCARCKGEGAYWKDIW